MFKHGTMKHVHRHYVKAMINILLKVQTIIAVFRDHGPKGPMPQSRPAGKMKRNFYIALSKKSYRL